MLGKMYGGAVILMSLKRAIHIGLICVVLTGVVGWSWYVKYSHGVGIIYEIRAKGLSIPALVGLLFAALYLGYVLFFGNRKD